MLLTPAQQQLHCVQYRIPYAEHRISYIVCRRVAVNQSSVKHALASSWTCQLVSEACHPAPTPPLFLCLSFFLSVAWQLHIHPQLVEIFHVSNRTWSHKSRTGLDFTFYSDSAFGKVFDSEIDQWLRFFQTATFNCKLSWAACSLQRATYNVQRATCVAKCSGPLRPSFRLATNCFLVFYFFFACCFRFAKLKLNL